MAGLAGSLTSSGLTHEAFTVQLVEAALARGRGRTAGFDELAEAASGGLYARRR